MKAVTITQPGGPDVLQIEERPVPECNAGDVLVKVHAFGINRPDVAQRKSQYPPPPGASEIPGLELAGEVTEVGADVHRWKIGDRVCALVSGGAYAEVCPVPAGQCLPVSDNITSAEAASLPETFFTVWSNVFDRAKLQPGETLLVHGGSSGIGVAAIQIATSLGSKVYVTAGSDEKCRFCEDTGAAEAINYKTDDFETAINTITGGKGVNVILDMIGGDYTPKNLRSLAEDGRLVMINTMNGKDVQADLSVIMRKRLTITGSTLRARNTTFKAAIAKALEQHVWPLIAKGEIKPAIYRVFKASEASAAHRLIESSEHMGKIICEW